MQLFVVYHISVWLVKGKNKRRLHFFAVENYHFGCFWLSDPVKTLFQCVERPQSFIEFRLWAHCGHGVMHDWQGFAQTGRDSGIGDDHVKLHPSLVSQAPKRCTSLSSAHLSVTLPCCLWSKRSESLTSLFLGRAHYRYHLDCLSSLAWQCRLQQ